MNTTKKILSDAPIYISLNGDLYTDKSKAMLGTLVGDPRMTALEAFLDSLSDTSELAQSKGDYTLGSALRLMVRKCHPEILANSDVTIEVTSKLDIEKHEMSHVFKISAKPKKP